MASFRIGIDVGGTFTHAVTLDAATLELVAQVKVPTTHRAARGVTEGVVEALRLLLDKSAIAPTQVAFLAYSTTQITNALLEGDTAPVGIVALGTGLAGRRARSETRLGNIPLAPERALQTFHTYMERDSLDDTTARAAVESLLQQGAQAIVAAEAFSVDDPSGEREIIAAARHLGLPATGTHEISGRYGLRVRTRTAAINASLLPRVIATADIVQHAAREIGIAVPIMVVRSDGGVMSADELRRRPLLTLLSGPAAGVAAALMYLRVSEGIFIEVGGTSTDISAIQHGRALLRTGVVGGHRLFLRTLDVRTVGVAGGSMPRVKGNALTNVGPRSAHLAGLPYSCFTDLGQADGSPADMRPILLSPLPGDPNDYAAVETASGKRLAITVTCAANAAGEVPADDWAHGNRRSALTALAAFGRLLGESSESAAEKLLQLAAEKPSHTVEALLRDRNMSPETVELVAGGGAASALAPAVSRSLGLRFRLAPNAPVVSAIGTALAAVREVIERTVVDPKETELLDIRREAAEAVIHAGADPEAVTVDVEYDSGTATLRAVATGQMELRTRDPATAAASDEERQSAAAKSLGVAREQLELAADAGLLAAYRAERISNRFFGLVRERRQAIAVVDRQGVVRLVLAHGAARSASAEAVNEQIVQMLQDHTRYGDAGSELPGVFLGVRGRIVDLSGLISAAQVLTLAGTECSHLAPDEQVLIAIAGRFA